MSEENNICGLPDWRNPDEYPPDNALMRQWAWEFLRRNRAYREFWSKDVAPSLNEDGSIRTSPPREKTESFGLIFPLDPARAGAAPIFLAQTLRMPRGFVKSQKGYVSYVFDLALPLGPQFERAMLDATEYQTRREREGLVVHRARARNDYRTYLRILDAKESGVPSGEIAKVLFSHLANDRTEKFKNARKAAIGLRDGKYLGLAAISD